jgi:hypothetical protein
MKRRGGFTLVELLVRVAILSSLVPAVLFQVYTPEKALELTSERLLEFHGGNIDQTIGLLRDKGLESQYKSVHETIVNWVDIDKDNLITVHEAKTAGWIPPDAEPVLSQVAVVEILRFVYTTGDLKRMVLKTEGIGEGTRRSLVGTLNSRVNAFENFERQLRHELRQGNLNKYTHDKFLTASAIVEFYGIIGVL